MARTLTLKPFGYEQHYVRLTDQFDIQAAEEERYVLIVIDHQGKSIDVLGPYTSKQKAESTKQFINVEAQKLREKAAKEKVK